jgi:hypothetical protein
MYINLVYTHTQTHTHTHTLLHFCVYVCASAACSHAASQQQAHVWLGLVTEGTSGSDSRARFVGSDQQRREHVETEALGGVRQRPDLVAHARRCQRLRTLQPVCGHNQQKGLCVR